MNLDATTLLSLAGAHLVLFLFFAKRLPTIRRPHRHTPSPAPARVQATTGARGGEDQ